MARLEPDLIILDIGLPEIDGLEVNRTQRRTRDTPVLFLTAQIDEIDRVLGLDLGADDYVTKPLSPRELVAWVKAIRKRTSDRVATPETPDQIWSILHLQSASHSCQFAVLPVALTATEITPVKAPMRHPDQVISRR